MAITVDNSIARVQNEGGTSVTTGSINTAAGDGLLITGNCDEAGNGGTCIHTISDNQTPDLTYNTEPGEISDDDSAQTGSAIGWYVTDAGAITGLTITDTLSGTATPADPTLKVYKLTLHDAADMMGARVEGTYSGDASFVTSSITPETSGVGFCWGTDWQQQGNPTGGNLTNLSAFDMTGDISGASGYKDLSAGVGATATWTAGSSTSTWNYIWLEIRAGVFFAEYEQEGFRFRNDDGSESAATWAAAQDTDITAPAGVNKRLRVLVDEKNVFNPPTTRFKLQYRKVGDDGWRDLKA